MAGDAPSTTRTRTREITQPGGGRVDDRREVMMFFRHGRSGCIYRSVGSRRLVLRGAFIVVQEIEIDACCGSSVLWKFHPVRSNRFGVQQKQRVTDSKVLIILMNDSRSLSGNKSLNSISSVASDAMISFSG